MTKYFALPLLLCLPLAGCGKRSPSSPADSAVKDAPVQLEPGGEVDPIAVPAAQKGGSFTTWAGPFPKSLNAWLDANTFSLSISNLLFDPLVNMHSTKDEPIGALADSWEISPDKKTYTFKINPLAKWSDGRPIIAEDVQFFYDVIMNPKNLTPSFRVQFSRFSRPEILDEKTIRITAREPHWANFWAAASMVAFPKHIWKDVDFNQQNFKFPVVSGPYAIEDIKMNRTIELKRRGDWWGRSLRYNVGKYNFDHLIFKAMEDRNKALELLKSGGLDLLPVYTAQIWAERTNFSQVQKNWIIRQEIYNKEPKSFQGLAMNLRRPLFQDARVREALAHLLNRELMNEKLMFNQYFLLDSFYPDLYPKNDNPGAPLLNFDPEKARALLKDAGWQVGANGILQKDGQPFSLTIMHYDGSDLRHLNIYLQALKSVGIDAKIDVISLSTFTKRMDNHDFDMFWLNTSASRLRDPEAAWDSKTANDVSTGNYTGVQDPEIDQLIEQQKTEMDIGKRNEILRRIDSRLVKLIPFVLMWQTAKDDLLYWNKFGTPATVFDKFNREDVAPLTYWWFDPAKARALAEAQKTNSPLPPAPAVVVYPEE